MIESRVIKQALKVHETIQAIGRPDDIVKSADMLGAITKAVDENILLRRQLAYTKFKTK